MTTWWSWQVRRARASRVFLVVLLAVVTATAGIIAGAMGYSAAAATTAARTALAETGRSTVVVATRQGVDPAAQDRSAREALIEGFAPAPIGISSTLVSEPRHATLDGTAVATQIVAISERAEGAGPPLQSFHLVEGQWPEPGSLDGALEVRTADRINAAPGSLLSLDGVSIRITGLWEDRDGEDTGDDGSPALVVAPDVVGRLGPTPFLRWDVTPDLHRITEDQLAALASGARRVRELVRVADTTGRGVTVAGDLAPVAAAAAQESGTAHAVQPISLIVLLLASAICAGQVLRLLSAARAQQEHLLLARGGASVRLAVMDLVEGLVVTVVGTVLGAFLAAVALRLVPAGAQQLPAVGAGALTTLALMSGLLLVIAAARVIRNPTGQVAQQGSRVHRVAGAGVVVLVAVAAAVSTWRLVGRDTAVVPEPSGVATDVIGAASPALLLAAAAVLALLVLGPLTRLLAGSARRMASTTWPLATVVVSRSLLVNAVPVVLAVLAAGTASLAAVVSGSTTAHEQALSSLAQGADLRVRNAPTPTTPTLPQVATDPTAVRGVDAASPVWLDPGAGLGDTTVSAVALPADHWDAVTDVAPTLLPPPGSLDLPPAVGPAPIELPRGARSLTLDVTATITVGAWERRLLELQRRSATGDGSEPRDAQEVRDLYAAPLEFDVGLRLRDAATGQGRLEAATTLEVHGPLVSVVPGSTAVSVDVGTASATVELPLDPTREVVLDGVSLTARSTGDAPGREFDLRVRASSDGVELFGGRTAGWGMNEAVPAALMTPYAQELAQALPPEDTADPELYVPFRELVALQPPTADVTTSTWRMHGPVGSLATLDVGPGVRFVGEDRLNVMAAVQPLPTPRVPIAVTRGVASAGALAKGDHLELITQQRLVPATIVEVVDAVVGTTAPDAVLMDSRALGAVLAWGREDCPVPQELWMALDPTQDADDVRRRVLALPDVGGLLSPPVVPGEAAQRALGRGLEVAAAGTLMQAIVGIMAAAAMQWNARRNEVATLRALGMAPRAQGASRFVEVMLVLGGSIVVGGVGGALVATLCLSALIHSVFPGVVPIPADVVWSERAATVLGALLATTMVGVASATALVVARQARAPEQRVERL